MHTKPVLAIRILAAVLAGFTSPLVAQCSTVWLPGEGLPGTNGVVQATAMWDPDGGGPELPRLAVGGSFTQVGGIFANSIATYEPTTSVWSALGTGLNGQVGAMVVTPSGHLVVGGQFSIAGGVPASCIARWDGTSWSALGSGVDAWVLALTTLANGDLVAGGDFTRAGGVTAISIARWNGTGWSAFGTGANSQVSALTRLPNGDLIAGGTFTAIGSTFANRIARWNGANWFALGSGLDNSVDSLAVRPNGDLVVGGWFTTAGGASANRIARWNGATWSALGTGLDAGVVALAALSNGDVIAGGGFSVAGGVVARRIARWNGASWAAVGDISSVPGDDTVMTLGPLPGGDIVAGGRFHSHSQNLSARNLVRWNGSAWAAMADGMGLGIAAIATMPNDDLVISGGFLQPSGTASIFRWNGAAWTGIGSGIDGTASLLTAMPNGDLVAIGSLSQQLQRDWVWRWNGTTWSSASSTPNGSTLNGSILAAVAHPNGDLIVGGSFTAIGGAPASRVARWNGITWSALGSGLASTVTGLALAPNDDLIATHSAGLASSVARWNGTSWSPVGTLNVDAALPVVRPNGDVLVIRNYVGGCGVSALCPTAQALKWDGATWSAVGIWGAYASESTCLPNGDVVVAIGTLIHRWDGSVWTQSALVGGTPYPFTKMTFRSSGELVVAGNFTKVGPPDMVSGSWARLGTTCPTSSTVSGAGCPSSGGNNTLAVVSQPWTGSTFRTIGTGLPQLAVVVVGVGLIPTVAPLSVLFSAGQPGCNLLLIPDIVDFVFASGGTATYSAQVPNTTALAGVVAHHQMVPVEIDAAANIVAITATNSIQLTIGSF